MGTPTTTKLTPEEIAAQLKQYGIPDSRTLQLQTFWEQGMRLWYQGELRRTLVQAGYDDRAVTLADSEVLDLINGKSQEVADSIVQTYNRMLENAIARGDDLDTFFGKVRAYNTNTLTPYLRDWTRGQAQTAFYAKNSTGTETTITNPTGGCERICQDWVSGGPYKAGEFDPPPYHQNCFCGQQTTPGEMVPDSQLWLG